MFSQHSHFDKHLLFSLFQSIGGVPYIYTHSGAEDIPFNSSLPSSLTKAFFFSLNLSGFLLWRFSSKDGTDDGNNSCQAKAPANSLIKNHRSDFSHCKCSQRPLCSVRWRIAEKAVCDPHILLEPSSIPRLVTSSRGGIRIRPSNGWTNNSMQWRLLHQPHFPFELFIDGGGSLVTWLCFMPLGHFLPFSQVWKQQKLRQSSQSQQFCNVGGFFLNPSYSDASLLESVNELSINKFFLISWFY